MFRIRLFIPSMLLFICALVGCLRQTEPVIAPEEAQSPIEVRGKSGTVVSSISCGAPTNLTVTHPVFNPTGLQSAYFSWSAVTNATSYDLVVIDSVGNVILTQLGLTSTNYTSANLFKLNELYTAKVRSNCPFSSSPYTTIDFRFTGGGVVVVISDDLDKVSCVGKYSAVSNINVIGCPITATTGSYIINVPIPSTSSAGTCPSYPIPVAQGDIVAYMGLGPNSFVQTSCGTQSSSWQVFRMNTSGGLRFGSGILAGGKAYRVKILPGNTTCFTLPPTSTEGQVQNCP
jgi:hypothetical protein